MRHLKRICLSFYTCLVFMAGIYFHMELETQFYPGKETQQEQSRVQQEEARAVLESPSLLSYHTVMVTKLCDLDSGEMTEEIAPVNARYVGMSRKQLVSFLAGSAQVPLLAERRQGLVSTELEAFSAEKVIIKKSYRKEPEPEGYYLAVADNRIVVYEKDRTSVYMETFLDARTLPDAVRASLSRGMELETKEELENFLVSYEGLVYDNNNSGQRDGSPSGRVSPLTEGGL